MSVDMDKDVEELLQSWNLSAYIPIFNENKITLETLSLLDSNLIKELIKPIGDRMIFARNLMQWNKLTNSLQDRDIYVTKLRHATTQEYQEVFGQNFVSLDKSVCSTPVRSVTPDTPDLTCDEACNDTENIYVLHPTNSANESASFTLDLIGSPASSITFSDQEQDTGASKTTRLRDLLNKTLEGRGLLNLYAESGLLSNNGRRKICNIIIKHLLENDPTQRISSTTLLNYAREISTLFKKENICTYFVPYISNTKLKIRRLAKGKLYDCLQNRKREYREATQNSGKVNIDENLTTKTYQGNQDSDSAVIEDIIWLQNSCDPWESVSEKWHKTAKFRHAEIMKESHTIQSYMEKYPALKKPAGFHLLVSDFIYQYPEITENLKETFPVYKQKILDLAVKRFSKHSDQGLVEFTEEYINIINEESAINIETTSIYAFMFLPLLLGNPMGKNKKKGWRPSKREACDAFITHVKAEADLKETITRRKEKYATIGLTLQPTIFIVGPSISDIKNYYIVVNNIFYVVNSIIEAVDVTFKLFFSLHCEFPTECYTVYSFLQKGLYKLCTKWDKEFTSVNVLLTDLGIN